MVVAVRLSWFGQDNFSAVGSFLFIRNSCRRKFILFMSISLLFSDIPVSYPIICSTMMPKKSAPPHSSILPNQLHCINSKRKEDKIKSLLLLFSLYKYVVRYVCNRRRV